MGDLGMKISVALATYNGGRHLQEQLDSIRRQSLLPWEIVICDDGSTDDTLDIARSFAATAPFPVLIEAHGQRLGFTRNFVRAIAHCTGEIVALCDQDDVWFDGKLAAAAAEFADKSVVTVTHRVRVVDERLRATPLLIPETNFPGKYTLFELDPWFAPKGMQLLFRRAPVAPWLQETPPLSTYGFGTAPFDEWIFCAGTMVGHSVVMPDVLGVWRRHASATTSNLEIIARDNSTKHRLRLALRSGGESYGFRAEVTDSRADFAARAATSTPGAKPVAVPGAVAFYLGMSRMFRRRVRLHDPQSRRHERLLAFVGMLAQRDYRARNRGGLGAKAVLKDVFTIVFGPRTPFQEAEQRPTGQGRAPLGTRE